MEYSSFQKSSICYEDHPTSYFSVQKGLFPLGSSGWDVELQLHTPICLYGMHRHTFMFSCAYGP